MGASNSTRKITLVNDESAGVIKLSESLAHRLRGQILDGQSKQEEPLVNTQGQDSSSSSYYPSPPPPSITSQPISEGTSTVASEVPVVIPEPIIDTSQAVSQIPVIVSQGEVEQVEPIIPPSIESTTDCSGSSSASEPPPPLPTPPAEPTFTQTPAVQEVFPPTPPPTPPSEIEDCTSLTDDVEPFNDTTSSPSMVILNGNNNNHSNSWSLRTEEAHLALLRLREEKDEYIKNQEEQWRARLANRENEYMEQAQLTQDNVNSSIKNVETLFLKTNNEPICQDKQDEVMKCFAEYPSQPLRCADIVRQFRACVDTHQLRAVLKEIGS